MATGFLTTACLCLLLGQGAGDVIYTNQRNHAIPVTIQEAVRSNIREVLLYSSTDQGRNWQQAGIIPPTKKEFAFYSPGDGTYWFRVAFVNKQGAQEPDDKSLMNGPPDLKMVIDTLKPIVRTLQVQRDGAEVYINWDVQEDHPDLSRDGLRLDYHVKDELVETWKPIPCQPGLKGQGRFSPAEAKALEIRLTVRDLAGNQSYSLREVSGTIAAAGFKEPVAPQFPDGPSYNGPAVPNFPKSNEPIKPLPPPVNNDVLGLKPPPTVSPIMPPLTKEIPQEKVVADSRIPPPPITPPMGVAPLGKEPSRDLLDVKPIAQAAPSRKLAPLQYVNQHQVMLEYELRRVGPSGIGGIEVWLTKDEGETWEPFAADEDTQSGAMQSRQKRKFDLRDATDRPFADGVYGLSLVVKSRAGLGKRPRPGDAPELRIEIDTQPPEAQLYMPVADPQHPDQVLIKWSAHDKNLAERPIHLEYSARSDGEWLPIKLDVENSGRFTNERVTGDYSWKVPPGTPLQVYLRLRVRDKAGNERVLVTPQPQYVDLTEPEGALIGVQAQSKAP